MIWGLVAVLLAAEPAVEVKPVEHGVGNSVVLLSSTVLMLAASTGAAMTSGVAVHGVPFSAIGRPSPWVTNVGLLVALGVQFTLAHLAVPAVASLLRPEHDVDTVREKAWAWSRWPLAAGALGTLTYSVGAALEQSQWGRGDAVMATGLIITVLSLIVFDVLEGVATWGAVR
jgi:hypothetical protein